MKGAHFRRLVLSLCFFVSVLLSGCTAQKSIIILLPEDGKVSGEVTIVNDQGSQVLNKSWQSVEISGTQGRPASPIVLDETTVQDIFGGVMAAMPLPPVNYLLYFKHDSAELLPDSKLLLPVIAKAIKERHPAQLSVVGHTDTMGTAEYNYQLGLLRARTVSALLALHGAAPAGTETSSRGSSDHLVKTPDQTLEPRNRRAEVSIR
ncbi:MAG: OmpA family protein [Desulfuromonadales bacterium]|nr:OmpA family protein [Desulfuromonadales bacterium]